MVSLVKTQQQYRLVALWNSNATTKKYEHKRRTCKNDIFWRIIWCVCVFFSLGVTFWWYISEYKYLPSIFLAINKSNVDIKTIKWMKIVSDVGWNNYFNGFRGWLCFLTQPFNMSALSSTIQPFNHPSIHSNRSNSIHIPSFCGWFGLCVYTNTHI